MQLNDITHLNKKYKSITSKLQLGKISLKNEKKKNKKIYFVN